MASNPTTDRQPVPPPPTRQTTSSPEALGEGYCSNNGERTKQPSEYRKHSLEDSLQARKNTSTKRVKASAPVSDTPQEGALPCKHRDVAYSGSLQERSDYQMQLYMLEQQNKAWLMMARREQEINGGGEIVGGSGSNAQISPGNANKDHANVLEKPSQANGESSAQLEALKSTGERPEAIGDYQRMFNILESQKEKVFGITGKHQSDILRPVTCTIPGSNGAQILWAMGPGITKAKVGFLATLLQEAIEGIREKPRKGGPSDDDLSQPRVLDNGSQMSPSRPGSIVSPHTQADSLDPSTISQTQEIVALKHVWDTFNLAGQALEDMVTYINNAKVQMDRGLEELPTTLHNLNALKDCLLPKSEASLQKQQDLLDTKKGELETLEAKYDDLIAMTPDAQKEGLQNIKVEAILNLRRDLEDMGKDEDQLSRNVWGTRLMIDRAKGDLATLKDIAPRLIEVLKKLLEKLP
ncbi:hypothetical protein N431DRAFT_526593 [Stipitochalara longipes BDJ]|nr:hypothetical protein N431DRAFT_526593 [Stipitochalara longipes BDJ]